MPKSKIPQMGEDAIRATIKKPAWAGLDVQGRTFLKGLTMTEA